jgi:3-isopropylmalate/(R)-2-methylmalate dehydratase large subunit
MGRTLAEKILLAHSDADDLRPGDFAMVRCDVVMANDLSTPHCARELRAMGVERVFDPGRVVLVADHFMPAPDTRSAELQRAMKDWAHAQGVTFYDQGRGGIEHTVLVEEGWIVPGTVVAGADSHTCTYGALGAFGTGMGVTDIAGAMALGEFWQIVPGTIRVELTGTRGRFVAGKDLILAVIAELGVAGATNMALEFVGRGAHDRRAAGGVEHGRRGRGGHGALPGG